MDREGGDDDLHVLFLPFMAQGHMIPEVDMAKIFASRGVRVTIVTTHLNGQFISKKIQRMKDSGHQIDVRTVEFPAVTVGLPEGCEHYDSIISDHTQDFSASMVLLGKFFQGLQMMQEPFETLLRELRPDCVIADTVFPWATDADSAPFLVPNLPGEIKLTGKLIPQHKADRVVAGNVKEAEFKSYGSVVNSFYELEPSYADHYRNDSGRKVWHIGPVSLFNEDQEDKSMRGREASIDDHECLKWLNSKKPKSVVYVCFGSIATLQASQLKEIATGLEDSGQNFIWVARRKQKDLSGEDEDWIPEGFEERVAGRGLILRGWAPQLLILNHEAVGGFVTHCGWNSTLEGIAAGLPMVTWPVLADQFFNEILVTQVLKTGISVGAAEKGDNDDISSEAVKEAVIQIMEGEEAEEMRGKAEELGKMAKRAIEEGGSSYSDLTALIEEMKLQTNVEENSKGNRNP